MQPARHPPTLHSAGFEARGLIFGAPLALALGAAFVPLRKPGKLPGVLPVASPLSALSAACRGCRARPRLPLARELPPVHGPCPTPGETIYADYETEYSTDRIEMHAGHIKEGQRVVLVDDLIATGGTLREPAPSAAAAGQRMPRWRRWRRCRRRPPHPEARACP